MREGRKRTPTGRQRCQIRLVVVSGEQPKVGTVVYKCLQKSVHGSYRQVGRIAPSQIETELALASEIEANKAALDHQLGSPLQDAPEEVRT